MRVAEIQERRIALMHPSRARLMLARFLDRLGVLSTVDRIMLDLMPYPNYAYGVLFAAAQSIMLGHKCVSVVEFGVAGGNGLLALERAARDIGREMSVKIDVFGLDRGTGMPAPLDYRDMPYWFKPGAYTMDIPKLINRLTSARLIVGEVEEGLKVLVREINGPIGFCSLDMDYYSSTKAILNLFEAPSETRHPRVMLYADDIFGFHDLNVVCCEVGEELAFTEFNTCHPSKRILPVAGLRYKRPRPAQWNEHVFALHDFEHPDYCRSVNCASDDEEASSLSLRT